jgi:peptidoglycan/LPS O-acetylase OafA/YrhL
MQSAASHSTVVTTKPKRQFRHDINALRAWAVLAVMLYHFGVLGFSGGFSGVDIFFVISGYLMTGIIVSGLESRSFSILAFYFARVKRIIPALFFLCVVLFVIGWFLLAPDDYATLAKHVKDSLLFVSNNTYRKESGYFDVVSHEKWLLHTWSLSVEWQFYLILPVMLWAAQVINKKKGWLFFVVLLFFTYSLIACIDKTAEAPTKAFYLIKYRYWEMLAGGIVYFLPHFLADKVTGRGLTLIYWISIPFLILPTFLISSESHWPGYLALLPVLGAAGFIYANQQTGLLINNPITSWLGERSYSLYLWHWPAVVLLDYFRLLGSNVWVCIGLVSALLLTEISYRLVETPFRKNRKNVWLFPLVILICAATLCVFARWVIAKKGLPSRVDATVVKLAAEKTDIAPHGHNCIYGEVRSRGALSCEYGKGDVAAVVLGDSHAAAIVTAVQAALPNQQGKVLLWSRAACPFVKGVTAKIDQNCSSYVDWVLGEINKLPHKTPIILITRSSLYPMGANEGVVGSGKVKPPIFFDKEYDYPAPEFLEQYRQHTIDTMCQAAKSRRVYWVKPIPEMKISVPQAMARAKMRGIDKRVEISRAEYSERHHYILSLMDEVKNQCGVELLDPLPYLCDDNACYGDKDGWPIYFDDDHLSESGNKLLVPMFQKIL